VGNGWGKQLGVLHYCYTHHYITTTTTTRRREKGGVIRVVKVGGVVRVADDFYC